MKTPIGKLGSYSLHRNGPRDDAVGATADFCTQNFGQTNPSSGRESHRTQESANSARDLAERTRAAQAPYGDFGKRTGRFEICARFQPNEPNECELCA